MADEGVAQSEARRQRPCISRIAGRFPPGTASHQESLVGVLAARAASDETDRVENLPGDLAERKPRADSAETLGACAVVEL